MPIAARQPEAETAPTTHQVDGPLLGDDPTLGVHPPSPGALLPTGDTLAPAPALTPARALALDALRLLRRLRDPARRPDRWATDAFDREVELVRCHLAPLRTRAALAGSYGREAFHHASPSTSGDDDPGAVRVAYALRWLELGARDARAAQRAAVIMSPCGPSARSPRPRPRPHRWRTASASAGRTG
jgi:hypothetical protein